jgi:hypothetical protein
VNTTSSNSLRITRDVRLPVDDNDKFRLSRFQNRRRVEIDAKFKKNEDIRYITYDLVLRESTVGEGAADKWIWLR